MVLSQFVYYNILGLPLIAYGGILTLIFLIITAIMGYLNTKGKNTFFWHKVFAAAAFIFALIHGTLGLLANLGF